MRINETDIQRWAPVMVALYKLWERTLRYEVVNWENVVRAKEQGKQLVFTHFHDETFCLPYLRTQGYQYAAIVSQSKDGEIMAQLLEGLGLVTARGSKSRGGVKALIQIRRAMRDLGRIGVVTVDGPRGPRHKVKEGAIYLAYKSDALLTPIRIFISRAKIFQKAWDKFQLPLPFARVRIVIGQPYAIEIPEDSGLDDAAMQREMEALEQRMLDLR